MPRPSHATSARRALAQLVPEAEVPRHYNPAVLYKYVPIERLDVLRFGRVRLTQPGALNDPFELQPSFDPMSKADLAALPEAPGQEGVAGPKMRQMGPGALMKLLTAIGPGLRLEIQKHEGQSGMFVLNNNRIAQATLDAKVGILSLSEVPDSLVMWAHYAGNHTGLVLQLDETHEFFAPMIFEEQSFELTKVEYSSQRPIRSYSTLNSPEVFYRKSIEWAYEREWRLIRPLANAESTHPSKPHSVHLFALPPAAIRGLIVGCAVDGPTRDKINEVLQQPALAHVKVFSARPSDDEYGLEIHPPLDGSSPKVRIPEAR